MSTINSDTSATAIPLTVADMNELGRLFKDRLTADLLPLVPTNGHQVIREFIENFQKVERDRNDQGRVAAKLSRQRQKAVQAACSHANKKHGQRYQSSVCYWDCPDCGYHYTYPTGPN